ncbi:sensor histidine kinase [Desulfovibrio inopinatus]|uniref:sensor histidine kinase n=1 Tax=Desulfovibrio inopinatus TaxID=102109 RepID=UPI00146FAA8D|nr:HAMP domain-containing sensor histidine kinase [Desulfovibrio inopinatus]
MTFEEFADIPKVDESLLAEQIHLFEETPLLSLFDFLPMAVLILNTARQAVYGNPAFIDVLPQADIDLMIGRRLGEAINCIHAGKDPRGCGASDVCRFCGAAQALLESMRKRGAINQCRIRRHKAGIEEALNLEIKSMPFTYHDQDFIWVCLLDITHEKRLQSLESLFFHDILNQSSALYNMIGMLSSEKQSADIPIVSTLVEISNDLIDLVRQQKELSDAEAMRLKVSPSQSFARDFLVSAKHSLSRLAQERGVSILFDNKAGDLLVETDVVLLGRAFTNLVKNAVEASSSGQDIHLDCTKHDNTVIFSVSNSTVISEDVRLQVFNRFFSTKGKMRGLGAYTAKVFVERYLGGTIEFTSTPEEKTRFYIYLPEEFHTPG